MKKFILAIIGPAFLAVGLLSSTTAISDDAKVDDILIAQGNGEQMACWGKLHLCFDKSSGTRLPSPFSILAWDESECDAFCNTNTRSKDHCTDEVCQDRCNTAYDTLGSSGTCDAPPEFASIIDLLKKSPVVASQPDEEDEAESVDST